MRRSSALRHLYRVLAGALLAMVPGLVVVLPAAAAPSAADRTMPHLKFVCPAVLGDHTFAGILPDGPQQEQCFFDDGKGSSLAVGASWAVTPADPTDTAAVCAAATRTSWYTDDSSNDRLGRFSATRRANAYIFLDLYWPSAKKLAHQMAMIAQLQALGDQMLAAAEELAQPCHAPAPNTDSPPQSTGPDEPRPTSTETIESTDPRDTPTATDGPLCQALDGQLTDNSAHAVEGIVVRLELTGQEPVETATDAQGRFHFGELPETDTARAADAARLHVLIRDGSGMWRIHAGADEAGLVTEPFALTQAAGCRHDLTTASLDGYESATPATPASWADLWSVAARTRRALDYMRTTLGVGLRDVPVVVYAWCPATLDAATCTPTGDGAFAIDRAPTQADRAAGLGETGRVPYLAIASGLTDKMAESPQDDTVYHELGHVLQADLAGGFGDLLVQGRTAHAGYANPSSNDSWVEGFASWFAISVRAADGRRGSYYEWDNHARKDVEHDIKAWDANGSDEEWAVAGLLTDLTDGDDTAGEQGRTVPFTTTGTGWSRLIDGTAPGARPDSDVVIVDLYDATGRKVGSDEAYLFPDGRFLDVPTIGFTHARVAVRPATAGTGRKDDDPFTIPARTVIQLINNPPNIGTRGGRTDHATTVFDLDELHAVLRSRLRRPKDVDALFVAHGFHENLNGRNTYVKGAAIGLTTHPPLDRDLDARHNAEILPTQYVQVDTRGTAATVVIFPQYGTPYATTPNGQHRVPVMIPGALDSRTAVVTLAKNAAPAVSVIEGRTFWPQAAKHHDPFLIIRPALQAVSTTTGPQRQAHDPADTPMMVLVGAGTALLAFGIGTIVIRSTRRRRRSRAQ